MEHWFTQGNYYMFGFRYSNQEPIRVVVARPKIIKEDEILFSFLYGHLSLEKSVKKTDILAVEDQGGEIQIMEWTRKYNVLNQQLFNQYVDDRIIHLKRE